MIGTMNRESRREHMPVSAREWMIRLGLFAGSFAVASALTYPGVQAAVGIEPCTVRPIEPMSYLAAPTCAAAYTIMQHIG
jgi:hypothetical protein